MHRVAVLLALSFCAAAGCGRSGEAPAASARVASPAPAPAPPPTADLASSVAASAVQTFEAAFPQARIAMNADTKLPSSVDLANPIEMQGVGSATDAAMRFVEQRRNVLLPEGTVLRPQADPPGLLEEGFRGIRLQQFYTPASGNEVPVFGGEVVVRVEETEAHRVSGLTSSLAAIGEINLTATVTAAQARSIAVEEFEKSREARDTPKSDHPAPTTPRLMLFAPARLGLPGDTVLTWLVDVGSLRVFVNARSGTIAHRYRNAPSLDRQVFECVAKNKCPLAFKNHQPQPEVAAPGSDAKALEAATLATYDHFKTTHGRNGYEGSSTAGTPIAAYAMFWKPEAFYDHSVRQLQFSPGWVTLDVVAHEYTHAILFLANRMEYTGQAGAVQEFFADLFAAFVDSSSASPWMIGEGLKTQDKLVPLRNLSKPHQGGFDRSRPFHAKTNAGQPAQMSELVLPSDPICDSIDYADGGCVHFNGAILAIAATLAVDGIGNGSGLGHGKFERIAYETMVRLDRRAPLLKEVADKERSTCAAFVRGKEHGFTAMDCGLIDRSLKAVGLP